MSRNQDSNQQIFGGRTGVNQAFEQQFRDQLQQQRDQARQQEIGSQSSIIQPRESDRIIPQGGNPNEQMFNPRTFTERFHQEEEKKQPTGEQMIDQATFDLVKNRPVSWQQALKDMQNKFTGMSSSEEEPIDMNEVVNDEINRFYKQQDQNLRLSEEQKIPQRLESPERQIDETYVKTRTKFIRQRKLYKQGQQADKYYGKVYPFQNDEIPSPKLRETLNQTNEEQKREYQQEDQTRNRMIDEFKKQIDKKYKKHLENAKKEALTRYKENLKKLGGPGENKHPMINKQRMLEQRHNQQQQQEQARLEINREVERVFNTFRDQSNEIQQQLQNHLQGNNVLAQAEPVNLVQLLDRIINFVNTPHLINDLQNSQTIQNLATLFHQNPREIAQLISFHIIEYQTEFVVGILSVYGIPPTVIRDILKYNNHMVLQIAYRVLLYLFRHYLTLIQPNRIPIAGGIFQLTMLGIIYNYRNEIMQIIDVVGEQNIRENYIENYNFDQNDEWLERNQNENRAFLQNEEYQNEQQLQRNQHEQQIARNQHEQQLERNQNEQQKQIAIQQKTPAQQKTAIESGIPSKKQVKVTIWRRKKQLNSYSVNPDEERGYLPRHCRRVIYQDAKGQLQSYIECRFDNKVNRYH